MMQATQPSVREQELFARLGWFVGLRWLFSLGLVAVILIGVYVIELGFPTGYVIAAAVAIVAYNGGFFVFQRHRRRRGLASARLNRLEAHLQIYLDLVLLTLLIHFFGGIESPFIFFYLFHAILSSLLLSRAEVLGVGCAILVMFSAVVGLEYAGVAPHYHVSDIFSTGSHQNLSTILVVESFFVIVLAAAIYMSASIVDSLRRREEELVAVREALHKKSTDLAAANQTLRDRQEQLVESEKLASLGQLVAGIAHEINNPIQFIQGNMQIIAEAVHDILPLLDEHHRQHPDLTIARLNYPFFREQIDILVQDMHKGVIRIRDIVKDLKTFARQDEGTLEESVDLNEVVRASMRLLHNKLKHLEVTTSLDSELPPARGNANRLEQVVVNTLMNAIEALAGRSDAAIAVTSRAVADGQTVELAITDNGPGMPPEVKRHVFDPFFTTKSRAGGSGLGMAISYGIIREHGGHIDLETEPGKGTTFRFQLPLHRGSA